MTIAKVHAVIISEDKVCKVLPKMSTTGDETVTLDPVERGTVICSKILVINNLLYKMKDLYFQLMKCIHCNSTLPLYGNQFLIQSKKILLLWMSHMPIICRHEFEEFEHVVTMKVMNLRSQETVTGRKAFIVIGSSTAHGEELVSRGKVIIII